MQNFTRSLSLLTLCVSTIALSDAVTLAQIEPGVITYGGNIVYGYNSDSNGHFLNINGKTTEDLPLLKTLANSDEKDTRKILNALVDKDGKGELFDGKKIVIPDTISKLPIYQKYNSKYNSRLKRWFSSIQILEHNEIVRKLAKHPEHIIAGENEEKLYLLNRIIGDPRAIMKYLPLGVITGVYALATEQIVVGLLKIKYGKRSKKEK